jgi:hypothetical protein
MPIEKIVDLCELCLRATESGRVKVKFSLSTEERAVHITIEEILPKDLFHVKECHIYYDEKFDEKRYKEITNKLAEYVWYLMTTWRFADKKVIELLERIRK